MNRSERIKQQKRIMLVVSVIRTIAVILAVIFLVKAYGYVGTMDHEYEQLTTTEKVSQ